MYRNLTNNEIDALKANLCIADDWNNVLVKDGFNPKRIFQVSFSGDIKLGNFEQSFDLPGGITKRSGVRYATLHIYNNVYTNQKKYGIDCRKDSRIYSECNSFEKEINSRTANKKGDFYDTGSVNLNRKDLDAKPVWNPSDYYKYKAQSAADAKKAVLANAGSGKLKVVR